MLIHHSQLLVDTWLLSLPWPTIAVEFDDALSYHCWHSVYEWHSSVTFLDKLSICWSFNDHQFIDTKWSLINIWLENNLRFLRLACDEEPSMNSNVPDTSQMLWSVARLPHPNCRTSENNALVNEEYIHPKPKRKKMTKERQQWMSGYQVQERDTYIYTRDELSS